MEREGGDAGLERPLSPCGSWVTKSKLRAAFSGRKKHSSISADSKHPQGFIFILLGCKLAADFDNKTIRILRTILALLSVHMHAWKTWQLTVSTVQLCLSLYVPQTSSRCRRRPGCLCSSPPVKTCCGHTLRYRSQRPWSPPDGTRAHSQYFGSPPCADRKIRQVYALYYLIS